MSDAARADLDDLATLERVAQRAQARDDGWAHVPVHKILAVVAELRAAREVVKAAAELADVPPPAENWIPLINALANYDQVGGS